jgi:hypothetical protein
VPTSQSTTDAMRARDLVLARPVENLTSTSGRATQRVSTLVEKRRANHWMLQENEKKGGERRKRKTGQTLFSIPGGQWPGRRNSGKIGTTEGVSLVEIQA